jgi:precorrin-6Y C5,15-methyltransferase (decarboxylating)
MHVLENLGLPEERIQSLPLGAATAAAFSELNFILLERADEPEVELRLGTEDHCFLHTGGMITKKTIRAAGLAALQLLPEQVVWDLGSGSGSVALEASLLAPRGRIIAVEKDPERAGHIRENVRRTGALCVEVVQAAMPQALQDLPAPDRVFIGGGLGREDSLLRTVLERTKPGGRIVLHMVLLGSLHRAIRVCREHGLQPEIEQLQVNVSEHLAGDVRFRPLNPVFIVTITTE